MRHTARQLQPAEPAATQRDGYTLVELLLVVVIFGILTAVVTIVVTGVTAEAAATGCDADRRAVHVGAETYFAQTRTELIPATGTGTDRYERTLVATGFLRSPSSYHELDATGGVVAQEGSPC